VIALELAVIVVIILASLLAPLLPLPGPNAGRLQDSLVPPLHGGHLLGTDLQGRDILSRILYGVRTSILIGLVATAAATVAGTALALLAGYVRGLDPIVMRLVDIQLSFPSLVLALAIVAALGGASVTNVVIVLVATGWVSYTRVGRAMTLSLKGALHIEAARSIGVRPSRILLVHILPSVIPIMVAMAVSHLPMVMIQEASLSYLGLGVPASTPTLGVMLHEGQQVLFTAWWPAVVPGVAMALVVVMLTSLGDWLSRELGQRS
jgi:peptide/nickel transport system permease protein